MSARISSWAGLLVPAVALSLLLISPGASSIPDGAAVAQEAPGAAADTAVFAGGCFWCMEPPFDKLDGVISTVSGYAGGDVPNPTYEQVTAGGTGHRESLRVIFDPARVTFRELLEVFWTNVDPVDDGGQFCDRGFSYTTAIFARDDEQARIAEGSKEEIRDKLQRQIVTPIVRGASFFPAEDYHQDYYQKNPIRYRFYRWSCGRDGRLEELWGK